MRTHNGPQRHDFCNNNGSVNKNSDYGFNNGADLMFNTFMAAAKPVTPVSDQTPMTCQ